MKKLVSIVFVTSLLMPFLVACAEPNDPIEQETRPNDTSIGTPVESSANTPGGIIISDEIEVIV